jgi:hypothetical protein
MPAAHPLSERLCAVRAAAERQDPIGSASEISRLLAVEMPTPWPDTLYDGDPDGSVIEQMWALRRAYFERLYRQDDWATSFPRRIPDFYGIASVGGWSNPSSRRVLLFTQPDGPFARFEAAEYAFPTESCELVELARAFFEAPAALPRFDGYRVAREVERDFFVCTHGQVDICCAKFGVPLALRARAASPAVRSWRMTHFGGHRYAPTAWEFPSGYKWGFLDDASADQVLRREGPTTAVRMNVRGWSGVASQAQVLDRVGLERFGWPWLEFRRTGTVIEADDDQQRWRVCLDFESHSGERGTYEGVVVVERELHETGCGPHLGEYDYLVPEYALATLVESWQGDEKGPECRRAQQ